MRLQDAKQILRDSQIRVCCHYPRLVLNESEIPVYSFIQGNGKANAKQISNELGIKIERVRNTLSVLVKKGFIKANIGPVKNDGQRYIYEVVIWSPHAEN